MLYGKEAYLETSPVFSAFLTLILSFEETRLSVVDAVRSCMIGPMLQAVLSPEPGGGILAIEPSLHLSASESQVLQRQDAKRPVSLKCCSASCAQTPVLLFPSFWVLFEIY